MREVVLIPGNALSERIAGLQERARTGRVVRSPNALVSYTTQGTIVRPKAQAQQARTPTEGGSARWA